MTDDTHDSLRASLRIKQPPGSHPTPEQLYRARRGPRTSEAERWLAHAAACALCTEEILRQEAFDAPQPVAPDRLTEIWHRFNKAPQPSRAPLPPLAPVIPIRLSSIAQPPGRPAAVSRFGLAGWGLAAALATGVVGLGLWHHAPAPPQASPLRGAAELPGTWQPSGLLDAPPTEILFPASPGGEPRHVTMCDDLQTYSWTSPPAAGGRVAFPEAERKKLRPDRSYFWTVVEEENAVAQKFRLRQKKKPGTPGPSPSSSDRN
jgi:hypothetical protein